MKESLFEFILPDLGEGGVEAEIRAWHVAVGERVKEHQSALEVETDKAVVDVPVPRAGIIRTLNHEVGDRVPVGSVLLTIATGEFEADSVPAPAAGAVVSPVRKSQGIVGVLPEAPSAGPPEGPVTEAPVVSGEKKAVPLRALPRVRALAKARGVALETLRGSGPDGRITEEDVLTAAGAEPSGDAGDSGRRVPLAGLRRRIAEHLLEAQRRTAFVTTMAETDVTRLWTLKARQRDELAGRGVKLTLLPFFMKATQHALAEFPRLNARVDEAAGEIELLAECHLGVAVDSREGLLVPVVRDVGTKSVVDLAIELQQLAEQAESRSLSREQLQGSTFTLTNFGSFGGSFATPVINYPNVAILGFGGVSEKPWVVEGEIVIRRILPLSLTFDHRVLDGAEATRFLVRVGQFLEDPGLLFIESV
ncbi:dihydrolipoamide acetyltransferase family protein [Geothermobacter hydrogeniphilus]|uniref:dihydrolipoamide acetyltransferase family protein n=1 Tax=Geothermobacter hydrogeniphilus TaxID=1969733 RepID=UPI001FEAD2FB|nr:dihydrolipoamide acetyltransferase family protein [Geothermobacter hydrogeniphilus]